MFSWIKCKYTQLEEFERVCVWILLISLSILSLLVIGSDFETVFRSVAGGLLFGTSLFSVFVIWNDLSVPR